MPPVQSKSEPHADNTQQLVSFMREPRLEIPPWKLRSQALTCAPWMYSRPLSAATSSHLTLLSLSPRLGRWCGLQQHHRVATRLTRDRSFTWPLVVKKHELRAHRVEWLWQTP